MVFGGTLIGGAQAITRAELKQDAALVADSLTANVKPDAALKALNTAADRLLKGKKLAIYDRTNTHAEGPRFVRQHWVGNDRAAHTAAVVKTLFAKAASQLANPQLEAELQGGLDAYLAANGQTIKGGTLKKLVDQLQAKVQEKAQLGEGLSNVPQPPSVMVPGLNEQQPLSPPLPPSSAAPMGNVLAPEQQEAPLQAPSPHPSPTTQYQEAVQPEVFSGPSLGSDLALAQQAHSQSMHKPALGPLPVQAEALAPVPPAPQELPAIVQPPAADGRGTIGMQAHSDEAFLPPSSAQRGRIEQEELSLDERSRPEPAHVGHISSAVEQDDAQVIVQAPSASTGQVSQSMEFNEQEVSFNEQELSFNEPVDVSLDAAFAQEPQGFDGQEQARASASHLSGQQMWTEVADQEEAQFYLESDAGGEQNWDYDDEPRFEDRMTLHEAYPGGDPSIFQDGDPDILRLGESTSSPDDDDDIQFSPFTGAEQTVRSQQLVQARAQEQARRWDEFVANIDNYSETLQGLNAELGRTDKGHAADLGSRQLQGSAGQLFELIRRTEGLLDVYDARLEDEKQLKQLLASTDDLASALAEAQQQLLLNAEELQQAMPKFSKDFERDDLENDGNARQVCADILTQTPSLVADIEVLLERAQSLNIDSQTVRERQDDYQQDLLGSLQGELSELKGQWQALDTGEVAELMALLDQEIPLAEKGTTTPAKIAQIRERMKELRGQMGPLRSPLGGLEARLRQAQDKWLRDFGPRSEVSERLQAAQSEQLSELTELKLQLAQNDELLKQGLERKVNIPASARRTEAQASNAAVADVLTRLQALKGSGRVQEDYDHLNELLDELLNTLAFDSDPLSAEQVKVLVHNLRPDSTLRKNFTEHGRLLILQIENERDAEVLKVMNEHAKKSSQVQRRRQELESRVDALTRMVEKRFKQMEQLRVDRRRADVVETACADYLNLYKDHQQAVQEGDEDKALKNEQAMERLLQSHQHDGDLFKTLEAGPETAQMRLQAARDALKQFDQQERDLTNGQLAAPDAQDDFADLSQDAPDDFTALSLDAAGNEIGQLQTTLAKLLLEEGQAQAQARNESESLRTSWNARLSALNHELDARLADLDSARTRLLA